MLKEGFLLGEKGDILGEFVDSVCETIHLHLLMQIDTTQIGDLLVGRVKLLNEVLVVLAEVLELYGVMGLLLGMWW